MARIQSAASRSFTLARTCYFGLCRTRYYHYILKVKMDCGVCNREMNEFETIDCNGCKQAYQYRCVNITPATAIKQKSTFKCAPCSNVTHRIRVTDETPVRSSQAAGLLDQGNEYYSGEGTVVDIRRDYRSN